VSTEMFLKPLEPLFKDSVDWAVVEQSLKNNLKEFFCITDFAKYSNDDDFQLFVTAKDVQTGERLGVIQFVVMQGFAMGDVRVAFFGVTPEATGRGIEKLLLSSIFIAIPAEELFFQERVERIFLHTRITNKKALAMYRDFGFVKFDGPLQFWTDMEYLAGKCDILQEAIVTLSQISD